MRHSVAPSVLSPLVNAALLVVVWSSGAGGVAGAAGRKAALAEWRGWMRRPLPLSGLRGTPVFIVGEQIYFGRLPSEVGGDG